MKKEKSNCINPFNLFVFLPSFSFDAHPDTHSPALPSVREAAKILGCWSLKSMFCIGGAAAIRQL